MYVCMSETPRHVCMYVCRSQTNGMCMFQRVSDSLRKAFSIERLIQFFENCEGGYLWKPRQYASMYVCMFELLGMHVCMYVCLEPQACMYVCLQSLSMYVCMYV